MKYQEAKEKFIEAWGTLGSSWGINRTMAQIHALLLIHPKALTADEIMEELKISRGNANMSIRALVDWGIVTKRSKIGERKEYFGAKKDIWELARQVSRERQRREISPILSVLEEVRNVEEGSQENLKEFKEVTTNIMSFTQQVDGMLNKFVSSDQNWFYKSVLRLTK